MLCLSLADSKGWFRLFARGVPTQGRLEKARSERHLP